MRLALGQLAPEPLRPERNVGRLEAAIRAADSDLAIFPELFLTGYRIGDRVHSLALTASDSIQASLRRVARETATPFVVGAPVAAAGRRGEVENAALLVTPSGEIAMQVKRYLPNFGPFEEAISFTPTDTSRPLPLGAARLGLEICYDAFFPEVSRELALAGADLLVNISASPVTSRRLFDRLLPARAIENGLPMVYVNRVGVEDGLVFGGGTGAWDARGEPLPLTNAAHSALGAEEALYTVEVDLDASRRWRPFRPVLRDVASRPPPGAAAGPGPPFDSNAEIIAKRPPVRRGAARSHGRPAARREAA